MKLGVTFPQTEIGADPGIIRDFAQTAEGLGYDFLLAYDHVLGANPERPGGWQGPYRYTDSFHEPFTLFSYLAALTETIEFVTGILILPQRQTALVAKQAAQVDVFSGGRLRLGIGIGWNKVEYEALNEDFHTRGKRSAEQVALLKELWTKPLVTFEGDFHSIPDAGLNPMPVQRPIPIYFGGSAEPVLKRMARLGDGWMPNARPGEEMREMIEKVKGYVAEAGRNPEEFGIDVRVPMSRHERDEWQTVVDEWREIGATHLSVITMGMGYGPEGHIRAIRDWWRTVGV
jgi:probable F420-dependent oxidoreductase